jgi:16S rRNA (guanine966-N2)-methyltransferase
MASRLRIVAGEQGGRGLRSPPGGRARPSAERTREAVFSMLGPPTGLRVLDLYCGTGAYALEALSRGAADAVLVDREPATAAANVASLGVGDRCEVVGADALRFLARDPRRSDLVFCDPPYRLADRLGPDLDKLLPSWLAPRARVIAESPRSAPLELSLPLLDERRYGAAMVRIYGARG